MIEQLTWALAGQIVVTAILAVIGAVAIVAGVAWIILWLFGDRLAFAFGMEACEGTVAEDGSTECARVELLPRGLAPWEPEFAVEDDGGGDVHEDYEHMRVVREAAQQP